MTIRRYDGFRMGTGDGMIIEIVDVPWWHIRRWFNYFFRTPRKDRLKTEIGPIGFEPARMVRCRIVDRREFVVLSE